MSDPTVFDWVCTELTASTELSSLEARGTVRIALREAGLEAAKVSVDEMKVVLDRVLPQQLTTRSVATADAVCDRLRNDVDLQGFSATHDETPEDVFSRLGGSR